MVDMMADRRVGVKVLWMAVMKERHTVVEMAQKKVEKKVVTKVVHLAET